MTVVAHLGRDAASPSCPWRATVFPDGVGAHVVSGLVDAVVVLFIAVDAFGVAPLYLGLTSTLAADVRRRILRDSMLVGGATSLAFAFVGKAVFVLLGITVADFKIAGGLVLLGLAVRDLVGPEP